MKTAHAMDRTIGLVTPLGALRSRKSIGVGEFPDLMELGDLCNRIGVGLIQLLPVNDSAFQSSPYSALTAFGLHPLYIRIGDLPEAKGQERKLRELGAQFEALDRFSYGPILTAKMALLREIFNQHKQSILDQAEAGKPLAQWIENNPWVREYAVYRRLKDENKGKHWKEWKTFQEPRAKDMTKLWEKPQYREEHLFWVWIQSVADLQFTQAATYLAQRGIVLKGDLPILMNEDSCDVWAHPEYFRRDLAAGAPPDMFSPLGQNWQFPIYDWEALGRDNYSWWRNRLALADRYYGAYRIDHVLGFFRIWAVSKNDTSAVLGRFIPSLSISRSELEALGFDSGRIRWLSQPHIPTAEVYNALRSSDLGRGNDGEKAVQEEAHRVFDQALDRIGSEELWLFKDCIKGERDIQALNIHPAISQYLQRAWRDRVLLEFEAEQFVPSWSYWDTRAFPTLSEKERRDLEALITEKRRASEDLWEDQGRRLLSVLRSSTEMLACAEDLGAVPDCVPRVLEELGILGLRVVRWARRWGQNGEPYIPLEEYGEQTVCTAAVHDSSTIREWWEREADRDAFRAFIGEPSLSDHYTSETARIILTKVAMARSRLRVFQIQDLLHLSDRWYADDPASERVNVPGSVNDFNWTYRLPAPIDEIAEDKQFISAAQELCELGAQKRNR